MARRRLNEGLMIKDPESPAANLEVGLYCCFVKGDWDTGLPLLAVMELIANPHEKFERFFDRLESGFSELSFEHERFEVARFSENPEDPDQVVMITETTAAFLHVRFLEVGSASVFLVPRADVTSPFGEVTLLVPSEAMLKERFLKFGKKSGVTAYKSGVEKGCLGLVVFVCKLAGLFD